MKSSKKTEKLKELEEKKEELKAKREQRSRESKKTGFRKYSELAKEANEYIRSIQKGEVRPIKTLKPFLDDEYPVLPQSVIVVGAGSGVGKTYELMELIDNIMNVEVNPSADDFVWANISLEMNVRSLILRDIARHSKMSKKRILYSDLDEYRKEEVEALMKKFESDERIYFWQEPITPDQFYEACVELLEENKDKELVGISIDHIALLGSDNGEQRNQIIENLMMKINSLKLTYPNVLFVLLSQLNSNRESRLQDKSIRAQPNAGDLYYSQFTFQIADYVYILVNPYRDKLVEYSYVIPEMYPNLEEWFLGVDNKGRTALEAIGVLYYHVIKLRDADDSDYIDIYAKDLGFKNAERLREQRDKDTKKVAEAVFDKELGKVTKKGAGQVLREKVKVEAPKSALDKLDDGPPI